MKKSLAASIAVALILGASAASASTLSINPTPATIPPGSGGTTPAQLAVVYDNAAGGASTVSGLEFEITFDDADLDLTVATVAPYTCQYVAGSGLITIIAFDGGGAALPSQTACNLTFTSTAGATVGESYPLTFQNVVASGNNNVAPTTTNGLINVSAAPPVAPSVVFNPNGGPVTLGGVTTVGTTGTANIAVTAAGGSGAGTASYTCTVPAGFNVTNASNGSIAVGSDPADMTATCTATLAAQTGTLACTRTGGDTTPVNFDLTCPAGTAVPIGNADPTPPNGTTLSCNGAAGSTQTTSVSFVNSGNANVTGFSCSVAGAGFTLTGAPTATIAPAATTSATVSCVVPADGAPANTGTLSCSSTGPAEAFAFPLSSVAQTVPTFVVPAVVPASSLWSKIGLIGLLAALGMLVVGLRRNH